MSKLAQTIALFSTLLVLIGTGCTTAASQNWMLSVYRDGGTTLRLDYPSKETCISAGNSYVDAKQADRFDCGFDCERSDDLTMAPLCKQICNNGGCR